MLQHPIRCLATAAAALAVAAGTAGAVDIDYFRTDTPEFMSSAKAGKQLFEAYQCALCHATREGQPLTKDIIAPNLILTKERLRPEWILEWIIDPQTLQPGTKMPNFFSFNTDDNDNNIYSDTDAHAQFKMILSLRDYLMILGTEKEAELARVGDDGRPLAARPASDEEPRAEAPAADDAVEPAAQPEGSPEAAAAPGEDADAQGDQAPVVQ